MRSSTAYPSAAVPSTHPARLGATAIVYGLRDDFSERFRYLELGCGDATNLLGLAAQFPEASFVGVDIDADVVARGEALRQSAGLNNVELLATCLSEVEPGADFDFVVSHGVYSWVSPRLQQRLLALSAHCLASDGVGYVSYNTLPGWGLRSAVRDVVLAAAKDAPDERARVRAARSAAARLQRHALAPEHAYGAMLRAELEMLSTRSAGYLLWEHLAEHNHPCHFSEFVQAAGEHGLKYLAETRRATSGGELELAALEDLLADGLSRIEAEQQLDLLAYRQLRGTLLCHEQAPTRQQPLYANLGDGAYFAGQLELLTKEPLLGPGEVLQFRCATGAVLEAERPLLKAALLLLARAWPGGAQPAQLMMGALGELRRRELLNELELGREEIERTADELVGLCRRRLLELLPWSPQPLREIGEQPAVSRWTRVEAERAATITSPRHAQLELDALSRVMVQLLDGSRNGQQLSRELRRWIDSGELKLEPEVAALADSREGLAELTAAALERVRLLGLLTHSG